MNHDLQICDHACGCATMADHMLVQVLKVGPKSAMEAYVVDLQRVLTTRFNGRAGAAVRKALKGISGTTKFTEADLTRLMAGLEKELGAPMAAAMAPEIETAVAAMYAAAKSGAAKTLGLKTSLNLVDKRTQKWLGKSYQWYIKDFHQKHLSSQITEAVRKTVIEQGLPRRAAAKEIEGHLNRVYGLGTGSKAPVKVPGIFTHRPEQYWGGLSNHAATTARVFADLESMQEADIQRYRISAVMDRRTCAICKSMDGKEFTVEQGAAQRDRVLSAKSPEQYKSVAGWQGVKGALSVIGRGRGAMAEAGMALPTYHYLCRCTIDAV